MARDLTACRDGPQVAGLGFDVTVTVIEYYGPDGTRGKGRVTRSMVDRNGILQIWGERWNFAANRHDNPVMLVADQTKFRKNEAQFSHTLWV
jgi:hypothetical protein